ncbi:MAG: hypothetical protein QM719_04405 [Thermomonas sp.]
MKTGSNPQQGRGALRLLVGYAALVAPALHTATDVMEWYQHGFSSLQLWLNYLAFLPMSWLLLGIYAVHEPKPSTPGLVGAVLYGAAFTYFAHTTLFAIAEHTADYELLWLRLGSIYTVHGALMIAGGLLFAWSAYRAGWLPRISVALFAAGLMVNLLLALVPAPDILQTIGSTLRNAGLVFMGYSLVFGPAGRPAGDPSGPKPPVGTD